VPAGLPDWKPSDVIIGKCMFLIMDLFPTSLQSFVSRHPGVQVPIPTAASTPGQLPQFQLVKLTKAEVAIIAHGIAKGLDHCNNNGIVHRDIKPDNILLRSVTGEIDEKDMSLHLDSEAIVTDFGCALVGSTFLLPICSSL
jgi:serine/threonine protein kinase